MLLRYMVLHWVVMLISIHQNLECRRRESIYAFPKYELYTKRKGEKNWQKAIVAERCTLKKKREMGQGTPELLEKLNLWFECKFHRLIGEAIERETGRSYTYSFCSLSGRFWQSMLKL